MSMIPTNAASAQSVTMTQYERANAVEKISGYVFQGPNESGSAAFLRAQAELLHHLRRQIECIEAITHDTYCRTVTPKRAYGT